MIQAALQKVTLRLKAEPFFLITLAATLVLAFLSKPQMASIKWNVIVILFSQMLVCGALEECRVLESLAEWILGVFKTPVKLGLAMVLFTGILAMLVTNDIALFTVVPVTLSMAKITGRGPHLLVILETISANIFSAMTPFGNPQNLYLYTYFKISAPEFFAIMLPFGLIGVVLLCIAVPVLSRGQAHQMEKPRFVVCNKRLMTGALVVFVLNILTVLRLVDYRVTLAVSVLIFIFLAPRLFKGADYILLLTFVLFFLFTDELTSVSVVQSLFSGILNSKLHVLLGSAAVSQVISNVPAAVLLSGFTPHYKELLYGVSAGGLGTLIASLASLISYKLYIKEFAAEKRRYMKYFLIMNAIFLVLILLGLILVEFVI